MRFKFEKILYSILASVTLKLILRGLYPRPPRLPYVFLETSFYRTTSICLSVPMTGPMCGHALHDKDTLPCDRWGECRPTPESGTNFLLEYLARYLGGAQNPEHGKTQLAQHEQGCVVRHQTWQHQCRHDFEGFVGEECVECGGRGVAFPDPAPSFRDAMLVDACEMRSCVRCCAVCHHALAVTLTRS